MLEELLSRLQEKQAQDGESGTTAAFELNWESLDSEAQTLACLLSLFALAPIPWSLVEATANASKLEFDLETQRSTLIQRYLLQHLGDDTYQLHEVIRDLLRVKLDELARADQLKRGFCQAMVAVAEGIPQTPTLQQILEVAPAIPHLAEVATVQKDWLSDEDLIGPFVGLAGFYKGQGAYEQALPWCEQCLSVTRERLGQEHPHVALSLNNLAALYYSQGRFAEAEPLLRQALELSKRLLGQEHPDVALSLNNLAALYYSQGRFAEAEPLYQQALELRKRLLGQEHPDVAQSLNNLAFLYKSQGRYAEAEPLLRQALELRKRLLGQEHPDVAQSLNNLALLYESQGRFAEAEPLYQQALELRKRLLGQEHPDVASSLNNLAALYKSQGRYAEAEPLYQQALEIAERRLGANHPNTVIFRKNLQSLRDNRDPWFMKAITWLLYIIKYGKK
jgi:tetratricopeptide (TPR) repeat protein